MFKKLTDIILSQKHQNNQAELYRNLIRHEAKIGGQVFGPVTDGRRREFFCLDRNTWVWHEEWQDKYGEKHIQTTRYDVRSNGIIKSQNGQRMALSRAEVVRLRDSARQYLKRVSGEMYGART